MAEQDSAEEKAAIVQLSAQEDNAAALAASYRFLAAHPGDPEAYLLAARFEIPAGRLSMARMLVASARKIAPEFKAALAFEKKLAEYEANLTSGNYRTAYLVARARHMNFPEHIQIETCGRCNANCNFCPHDSLERKFSEMDDALYEKIISDSSVIPPEIGVNFFLNVVNEPFMDKKIFDRIAILNDRIPQATFGLFSNMNVLPKSFFEGARRTKRWTLLNVSFNAAHKVEYEDTMGIDFDRTVANLRAVLSANAKERFFSPPMVLSRVATYDERDDLFSRQCQELFSEFQYGKDYILNIKMRASWLGDVKSNGAIPHSMPCTQWLNISVHCDGTVPHCCLDATGQFRFGNARDASIIDIYNSPQFRNMRQALTKRETYYPCNTCELK